MVILTSDIICYLNTHAFQAFFLPCGLKRSTIPLLLFLYAHSCLSNLWVVIALPASGDFYLLQLLLSPTTLKYQLLGFVSEQGPAAHWA